MAAYQANYGFKEDGTPDANAALADDTKPAAPSTKGQGAAHPGPTHTPGQDQNPVKDAKQKGEKRKAEAGGFKAPSS